MATAKAAGSRPRSTRIAHHDGGQPPVGAPQGPRQRPLLPSSEPLEHRNPS